MASPNADVTRPPRGGPRPTVCRAVFAGLFILSLFPPAHLRAQKKGDAPRVAIQASASVVNVCAGEEAAARVRLKAAAEADGCAARYTWSANGGRILGEGPEVVWDLSGLAPDGKFYDVTLTVENRRGCGPRRTVSAPARVAVWGCPPRVSFSGAKPRPAATGACPSIALCCRAVATPEQLAPFSVTLSGGTPGVVPKLRWTLSGGRIAEGQGTDAILVDTKEFKGRSFLTTVEVENYGRRCSATCTTEVARQSEREKRPLALHVSVRDARTGRPVPRARIAFFLGTQASAEAKADEGGLYRREGWAPGQYRVVAFADRYDRLESNITLDQYSTGSVVLSLSPSAAQPTPSPKPTPSPTPSPSPSVTPAPATSPEVEPSVETTVPLTVTEGWSWLPWLLGLAVAAALCAVAYALLKGGASASLGGGAIESPAAAAGATKQSDKVYCTVFGPKSAAPGSRFITQVFAHLKEQEGELEEIARRCVGQAAERFVSSKRMGREIERDAEIFFRLEMEGLEVAVPEQTIFWDGVVDSVTFNVKVPEGFRPGEVLSNVVFGVVGDDGRRNIIGHVNFMFQVVAAVETAPLAAAAAAAPPAEVAAVERPAQTLVEHERAFISYASEDKMEVLKRVQAFKATGVECFMDKLSFRTGEEWEAAILRFIEQSDVFYLFWSRHASQSDWVLKEIDLALKKQQEAKVRPLIQPMPLEDTTLVPPPERLRHLHFDDTILDHIDAQKYRDTIRPQDAPTK